MSLEGILYRRANRFMYGMAIKLGSLVDLYVSFQRISLVPSGLYDYVEQLREITTGLRSLIFPGLFVRFFASVYNSYIRPS